MADKADAKKQDPAPAAAPAAGGADAPKKGGLPMKTLAVVMAFLVIEAGTVFGLISFLGKPSEVKATHMVEDHSAEGDKLVEIPLLAEKFTNNSSGQLFVWDIEIIAQVKSKHAGDVSVLDPKAKPGSGGGGHGGEHGGAAAKHEAGVAEELKARIAEIRTGVGTIISSAQHPYFTEPGRETLTRQILEYLREVFKQDPAGEERIAGVLIPKCLGFRSDF